ncbi:MAG: DNA-binding MarR family transcriptional regulator [Glaciecola sp.]|jgi:DNA-binding MarR family transcriptional regulator|uniref:MarR family winged helix-turn-helix transcriptional regulator n=1 Tax=Congregibacter sp. TaxID=2744308 RepID=UPI0039E312B0
MKTLNPRAKTLVDLWLASERLSARIDHNLGSVHGIGYVEFMVLYQLARCPDLRMRRVDLATAIGRTASGVTRLLKPMENTGFIARDSSDRDARVSLVTLTSAGQIRLEEALTTMNGLGQRLTQALGDSQLDSAASALAILRD